MEMSTSVLLIWKAEFDAERSVFEALYFHPRAYATLSLKPEHSVRPNTVQDSKSMEKDVIVRAIDGAASREGRG